MTEDPLATLVAWRDEARTAGEHDADAMALATASPTGVPSVRIVLFRGISQGRLRFFTNYESKKGRELDANPKASVCFYWPSLGRQLRVEGTLERLSAEESDAYFAARPRGHQLGALASDQSRTISGPQELEERHAALDRRYAGQPIPRPTHWGGFGLVPERIELWISKDNRLHERRSFEKTPEGWRMSWLAP